MNAVAVMYAWVMLFLRFSLRVGAEICFKVQIRIVHSRLQFQVRVKLIVVKHSKVRQQLITMLTA